MRVANSKAPTNKVAAGVFAGSIVAVIAWAVRQFYKVDIPAEIAMAGSTAITFVVQYLVPDAEVERSNDGSES